MKRTIIISLFGFSCTFLYTGYLKILEDIVSIDKFDISYETINLQIENVMRMGDRWQALGKSLSLFNHNITSETFDILVEPYSRPYNDRIYYIRRTENSQQYIDYISSRYDQETIKTIKSNLDLNTTGRIAWPVVYLSPKTTNNHTSLLALDVSQIDEVQRSIFHQTKFNVFDIISQPKISTLLTGRSNFILYGFPILEKGLIDSFLGVTINIEQILSSETDTTIFLDDNRVSIEISLNREVNDETNVIFSSVNEKHNIFRDFSTELTEGLFLKTSVSKPSIRIRFHIYLAGIVGILVSLIISYIDFIYIKNYSILKSEIKRSCSLYKQKNDFISRISHEILTPLNLIVSISSGKNRYEIILSIEKLSRLLRSVILISQLESNDFVFTNNLFELKEIQSKITELCDSFILADKQFFNEMVIEYKNIKQDTKLLGDFSNVMIVISNIMDLFSDENHDKISIEIEWSQIVNHENMILMKFKGQNEFKNENDFRKSVFLSVCKSISVSMGGNIYKIGNDIVFSFRAHGEFKNSESTELILYNLLNETIEEEYKSECKNEYNGKILIVDDIYVNICILKKMVELLGFSVDFCLDGLESIELCSKNKYDFIFMDQMMPGISGMECVSSIRKGSLNIKTPVCYVTADASMTLNECMISGGNEVLYKPIKFKSISNLIEKYIKN